VRWTIAVPVTATVALLCSRGAHADSCTSPDLIETIPASGATDVPTNASLFARYATIAQYLGEPVVLEHIVGNAVACDAQDGGADAGTQCITCDAQDAGVDAGTSCVEMTVQATFDDTSGLLQITPPMPLVPGDSYVVRWPALRGIDTATLGMTQNLAFTAGTEQDVSPPTFAGITSVSWDVSRNSDPCNGAIDQRYVFDLALGTAASDAGRDSLTLLVFQTSGPAVEAGTPAPVLVQRIPPEGQAVQVSSAIGDAVGHICFAAIVRDLTLKASTSGSPVCVDTVAPPFFYGCGVTARARGGVVVSVALVASLLALARRARRRARGHPAPAGQGRGGR